MCVIEYRRIYDPHRIAILTYYTYMQYQCSISCCACSFAEPVRFDSPVANVSSKRNDAATLSCIARGDEPIQITWSHNGARIDLNNYRYIHISDTHRSTAANLNVLYTFLVSFLCVWLIRPNAKYRLNIAEMNGSDGVNSQLSITRSDRHDSGAYKCLAENKFGTSEHTIYLAVQGNPSCIIRLYRTYTHASRLPNAYNNSVRLSSTAT